MIGQLLIDFTKLTPARILVGFVVAGVIISAIGWYQPLVDFAGAGATVPLTGFGHTLATGVKEAIAKDGIIGIFTGGKVLFIAPDKDTKLIALKEKFGPSFDWTPHTTMLIDEPENIQQALPLVVKEFSSFHGKVTCLHLYEFWPTRHISTVRLR